MAQAALTALDTWTARDWRKEERQWREELRRWRADDVAFRAEERRFKAEERMFRTVRHRWRHEIMQQRHVDNAMHLWDRTKECNRRSVEEKAEHMRAMAWLAAIVGGFTMTAPVEFTYSDPDAPMALVTAYALCTALVPSLMVVAAMIAVFVLGAVLRMGKLYVHEREEEEFLASARYFALNRAAAGGNRTTVAAPPAALRSFDRFWDLRCESDWRLTFRLFSAGITFFFPLLATMAFLKFHPNIWIPSIFSSVLLVALIQWFFLLQKWGRYLTSPLPSSSSSSHPLPHTPRSPHSTHDSLLMHIPRPPISNHPIDWHIRPLPLLPPSGDDIASSTTYSGNLSDYGGVDREPYVADSVRSSYEHTVEDVYSDDDVENGEANGLEGDDIGLRNVQADGYRQLELMQVSGLLEGVVRGVDFDVEEVELARD